MSQSPRTLPGNQCMVHRYHWPVPARTVKHHIHPKEFGGTDARDNLALVCDTGHYNIHAYIDAAVDGKPLPKIHKAEKAIATAAIHAVLAVVNNRRRIGMPIRQP